MSDERTRTTKEVRDGYAYDHYSEYPDPYYELRFDRWLAAHDAEIRTAALEEAAVIADRRRPEIGSHINGSPYRSGKYDAAVLVAVAIRAAKDGAR